MAAQTQRWCNRISPHAAILQNTGTRGIHVRPDFRRAPARLAKPPCMARRRRLRCARRLRRAARHPGGAEHCPRTGPRRGDRVGQYRPRKSARRADHDARSRVSSLFVAKVNEQKSKFGENITRLVSGDYALTIACELYVDYRIFPQDKVIQASLRAGRVYRLRAEPEGRRCQPEIEDVTDREK